MALTRRSFNHLALFTGVGACARTLLADDVHTPRPAGQFTFNIPGEAPHDLSQYLGKVVALEFIFTTCPHCQAASKVMSKLQTEYGPRGLQVLDVAVNDNADLLVDNFAKDFQTTFPVGWVKQDQMTAFMGFSSGRFVVPQLALIDRKGVIRYQTPALESKDWESLMNEDALRQHIEELLGTSAAAKHASHVKTASR